MGLGFLHRAGRFRRGESPFSSPYCRSSNGIEEFIIRGWEPILPEVRWLYVQSPASQRRPVGLVFPPRAGRFRPGGSPLSSSRCRSCGGMEGLLNRGWGLILPVYGEFVGFPRGATPVTRASPPDGPRASPPPTLGLELGKRWDESHLVIILCN